MKLRNKTTGEINEFKVHKRIEDSEDGNPVYAPFYGHIDDWEDYEEPEEYWFIDYDGGIIPFSRMKETATDRMMKQIGNYFDSREEAEKAVKKLKAWKRLKDKGFRFTDYDYTTYRGKGCGQVFFNGVIDNINEIKEDLDLLFGGEE